MTTTQNYDFMSKYADDDNVTVHSSAMDIDIQADGLDIEEVYIEKLRTQRQRIEQLSLLYNNNEDKLRAQTERNKELQEEVDKVSQFREYKTKFDSLRLSYEELAQQYHISQGELEDVKQELAQVIHEKSQSYNKLKSEYSNYKTKMDSENDALRDALQEKEEELETSLRSRKNIEDELHREISSLKETIIIIKKENAEVKAAPVSDFDTRQQKELEHAYYDLKSNFEAICRERDSMMKEISITREDLTVRETELNDAREKARQAAQNFKKDLKEKESQLNELKTVIRKKEKELKEVSEGIQSNSNNEKKIREMYEAKISELEMSMASQYKNWERTLEQHINTIEELMRIKAELLAENKKMAQILNKKQELERQRRQLLKTEFREIDKLEKVIDRITE